MNFPTCHIVSLTLSAALHLLGLLAFGSYTARPASEMPDTLPELDITSVELTLSEAESEAPGGVTAPEIPPPIEPMPLPQDTPIEQLTPPKPLPPPELPKPIEPEPIAEPELVLPPPEPLPPPLTDVSSEIAINEPVAKPQMPDFDDLPEPPEPPPEPPPPPPEVPPAPPPPPQPEPPQNQQSPIADHQSPITPPPPPVIESAGSRGKGGASGRVDGNPSLERTIKPDYPIGARRRGEEGSVVLDVTVAASGRAASVAVVTSSGFPELDSAAERAALQARFKPAKRDGRSVEATARLTLVFRLRDQ